jgi:dTDP-4-amino-4,6-dideoxygalactose transaminase
MNIPFVDLQRQYQNIKSEIDLAIKNVLDTSNYIGGPIVTNFENDFAKLLGVKHCIGVANGTDAIYIVLKSLGIGTDDEVITVANSWISTSETISQTGAKPVFVDINPETYTIDVSKIESKITKKTKAIIPVHLYGQMAEINAIKTICERYNLFLIEDCAQSHLSEENSVLAGTTGIAGTFSFYPGKNLGAYGDAGAVITNNDDLASKMRMYANHGALVKHKHQIEGINSRLDTIQAAILHAKLPHLISWTQKRIDNANRYDQLITNAEIIKPKIRSFTKHTFHLYVIRHKKRNELQQYLQSKGVQTSIHYPTALPNLPAYQYLNHQPSDFPIASAYQNEILSLPMFPELTHEEIEYVSQTLNQF